jgi:hypothetical protein
MYANRCGEVGIEVCVARTRNMAVHVGLVAYVGFGQLKSAVDNNPPRVAEMGS